MLKLIRNFNRNIHENIRENRRVFLLYTVLRVLVIVALVRAIMNGNYNGAFICLLSLGLFLVPSLLEQGFKIHIPPLLEGTIYLFIFSAEILGELNHFYAAIPQWDTILHTLNGFLAAAVGFSMIDLLNRNSRHFQLSPFSTVAILSRHGRLLLLDDHRRHLGIFRMERRPFSAHGHAEGFSDQQYQFRLL